MHCEYVTGITLKIN